jgi:hypothetical protein
MTENDGLTTIAQPTDMVQTRKDQRTYQILLVIEEALRACGVLQLQVVAEGGGGVVVGWGHWGGERERSSAVEVNT